MKKWNGKNALRILLYLALYMAGTAITCFTGAIHPIVFVCYQITAGILLSGIVIKGFDQVKAPGVAAVFAAGVILIFVAIERNGKAFQNRKVKRLKRGSTKLRKPAST